MNGDVTFAVHRIQHVPDPQRAAAGAFGASIAKCQAKAGI
jgi:hypothetical protein